MSGKNGQYGAAAVDQSVLGQAPSTAMHKFAFNIGDARSFLARRVSAGILVVFQGCATQSGAAGRAEMVCDTCASLY